MTAYNGNLPLYDEQAPKKRRRYYADRWLASNEWAVMDRHGAHWYIAIAITRSMARRIARMLNEEDAL